MSGSRAKALRRRIYGPGCSILPPYRWSNRPHAGSSEADIRLATRFMSRRRMYRAAKRDWAMRQPQILNRGGKNGFRQPAGS